MRVKMCAVGLLIIGTNALAADEARDAQAGCDKYPLEMNREWSLMITDPYPMKSYAKVESEARFLPLDRRVALTLHPKDQVSLVVTPEKDRASAGYVGVVPVRLPFSKRYRISSTKPFWIDVMGPNGVVNSTKSAEALGCERLVKTVIFRLEADTDYWLQFSSGAQAQLEVILTLDR